MQGSTVISDNGWEKVVVHLDEGLVKGFLESNGVGNLEDLLGRANTAPPALLRIRRLGDTLIEEIPLEKTKALFFVKEFDGNPEHRDLRFYRGAPIVHGVWVRLEFSDGEIMEGLVHNTAQFLVDSGFFILPTDPNSNNRLVYVVKTGLKECRILGLRNIPVLETH